MYYCTCMHVVECKVLKIYVFTFKLCSYKEMLICTKNFKVFTQNAHKHEQ